MSGAREIFSATVIAKSMSIRVWKQNDIYVDYDVPSITYPASHLSNIKSIGTTATIKD